jgi:hypothetical protein
LKTKGSHGPSGRVIREILCHVAEWPDAKDTADGIHKFWLSKHATNRGRKEVREALNFLVFTKGWLIEKVVGSSEKIYGLNRDRLAEIKHFLKQSGNGN